MINKFGEEIFNKKFKLLNKKWIYFRFKKTGNESLDKYFQKIKSINAYKINEHVKKSESKFKHGLNFKQIRGTFIPKMTKDGLKKYKKVTPHTAVQKYFLEQDMKTIATEIPIYSKTYQLGGFIDLLRYDSVTNEIEIMDFKTLGNEGNVGTQLKRYGLAFSDELGWDFDKIKLSYFSIEGYYTAKKEIK